MILIDDREPQTIRHILMKEGIAIKPIRLTVGDYILGEVGIERKSVSDLYRSIIDRRLFDQAKRLKEAYEKPVFLIEGDLDNLLYTITNPHAILGALTSIAIDYSIPLLYSRNEEDTARIIIYIWRKVYRSHKPAQPRYKPKLMTDKERIEFIVQSLPNIGPRLAKNILIHYRTLKALFTTTPSELKSVEGVGEKRAEEIYRLINLDYTKL